MRKAFNRTVQSVKDEKVIWYYAQHIYHINYALGKSYIEFTLNYEWKTESIFQLNAILGGFPKKCSVSVHKMGGLSIGRPNTFISWKWFCVICSSEDIPFIHSISFCYYLCDCACVLPFFFGGLNILGLFFGGYNQIWEAFTNSNHTKCIMSTRF